MSERQSQTAQQRTQDVAWEEPTRSPASQSALKAAADVASSRDDTHHRHAAVDRELAVAQSLMNATLDEDEVQALRAMGHERFVTIHGQKIEVYSDAQAASTRRLLALLSSEFGITLSSSAARDAYLSAHPEASARDKAAIEERDYEYKEVVAIVMAARFYAPLLGRRRDPSLGQQPITYVGKIAEKFGADARSNGAAVSPDIVGESIAPAHTIFTTAETTTDMSDFLDAQHLTAGFKNQNQMELVGTMVHELSHTLMLSQLGAFMAATKGYWLSEDQSNPAHGEKPVTEYGATNAREDLCETMMFFAVDKERLRTQCPHRFEFAQDAVASWSSKRR